MKQSKCDGCGKLNEVEAICDAERERNFDVAMEYLIDKYGEDAAPARAQLIRKVAVHLAGEALMQKFQDAGLDNDLDMIICFDDIANIGKETTF